MIGPIVFLAICCAGGVGAALRFLVDGVISSRSSSRYPIGTTVVNVTGSLGLGVLTGAAAHSGLAPEVLLIAGGGLMGGFTTFSTASLETVRLARAGRLVAAASNGVGMLLACVVAAGVGLFLGGAL